MRTIFNFIGSFLNGLGIILGSIVGFFLYAIFGYCVFLVLTIFLALLVDNGAITNEYILQGFGYIFGEYKSINELIFAGTIGLLGALKMLRGRK